MVFQRFIKLTWFNFIVFDKINSNIFINIDLQKLNFLIIYFWMIKVSLFANVIWKRFSKRKRYYKREFKKKIFFNDSLCWRKQIYPSFKLQWGDQLHNCIRSIMNVKFFKNARRVLFHQIYVVAEDFGFVWRRFLRQKDWEENGAHIYNKIRSGIKFLRLSFSQMFNKVTRTVKQTNTFFHPFRKLSSFQFLWFTEFNLGCFLIKLKFSTSLFFSRIILWQSWVFLSDHIYPHTYSIISPNTYLQFLLGYRTFFFVRYFFFRFFRLLKFFNKYLWTINKRNRFVFYDNRKKEKLYRFFYLGVFDVKFTKLFEMDYMTLTFIFLPPWNEVFLINYIYFVWANHWNHKVVTWKYLT